MSGNRITIRGLEEGIANRLRTFALHQEITLGEAASVALGEWLGDNATRQTYGENLETIQALLAGQNELLEQFILRLAARGKLDSDWARDTLLNRIAHCSKRHQ